MPDLATARRTIERGVDEPITLLAAPFPDIPRRWIPVPFDTPDPVRMPPLRPVPRVPAAR